MIKGRYTDFDDGPPAFSVGAGVGDALADGVAVALGIEVDVAVDVAVAASVGVGVALGRACHKPPLTAYPPPDISPASGWPALPATA